jgi:hypothetical protein
LDTEVFWKNLLPPSSGQKTETVGSSKVFVSVNKIHGFISHIEYPIFTTPRTSNVAHPTIQIYLNYAVEKALLNIARIGQILEVWRYKPKW